MKATMRILVSVVFAVVLILSTTIGVSAQAPAPIIPLPLRIDVNTPAAITPNNLFGIAGQSHRVFLESNMLEGDGWLAVNDRAQRSFDWGDGSTSVYNAGQVASHTWQTPGIYTIRCHLVLTTQDGGQVIDVVSTLAMAQMVEQDQSGFIMNAGDTKAWSAPNGKIVGVLVFDYTLTLSSAGHVCLVANGTSGVNLCMEDDVPGGFGDTFTFPYMSLTPVTAVVATLEGQGNLSVRGKTLLYYIPVAPAAKKVGLPKIRLPVTR